MKTKQVTPREVKVPLLKNSKYIDPLSDWGFKRLFGSEPDKEILIDFLNARFEGEKQIVDLMYSAMEYSGETKETSEQFKKGETNWKNWGLKEVYLIGLLEFVLTSNTSGRYLRNIALTDTNTGEVFYSKLGYKFIELPNFLKTEVELVTDIDKWLYC